MILNHELKYICIAIPKTGSISVHHSLCAINIPEPEFYHQGISRVLSENPECSNYFKFTFVRNPWARLISLYKDFTVNRVYKYSALVRHKDKLFGEFKDFEDFCLNVKSSPWWDDIFLQSQTKLTSINGNIVMDFIGRFERLQDDFNVLCDKLGTPHNLIRTNVGKYDNSSYQKYYTDAARDAVAEIYSDDVKNFNYEF